MAAHVAAKHGGRSSTNAPTNHLVRTRVPTIPWELSARSHRRGGAGIANVPEPDATPSGVGEKATAARTLRPQRRIPASVLRTFRWVAVAAICIAAAGLVIAFPHQIAHQIALVMTTRPTPSTELYFSDPNGLPKSLSLSGPNLFGFTVVNHEGHDIAYSYVVMLGSSYGSSTIAQGRIDLRNNMAATRLINVRPTQGGRQYLIKVNLLGPTESIWFRAVSQ